MVKKVVKMITNSQKIYETILLLWLVSRKARI
jgi:hypothetical protein